MAKEKKKRKRLRLKIEGKPVYDPEAEYVPYSPFKARNFERDDPGEIGIDGLTLKQRLFVDAYVGPAAGSVGEAAFMAGYGKKKPRVKSSYHTKAGMDLLRLPLVQEGIAHALAAKKMSPEWTKLTLFELANSNLNNFVDVDESGSFLRFNFRKAEALGAMRQLKEYDAKNGKIKVHDVAPYLRIIAEFYNLVEANKPRETPNDLPLEEHPLNRRVSPPAGLN